MFISRATCPTRSLKSTKAMPAAPRRVMSRARACPMPPAAPVITATCPLIVCILTAPPDGASRVLTLYVSRPGSSMVLEFIAFINHYYNFPRHSSRPILLLRNLFLRLQKHFDRKGESAED